MLPHLQLQDLTVFPGQEVPLCSPKKAGTPAPTLSSLLTPKASLSLVQPPPPQAPPSSHHRLLTHRDLVRQGPDEMGVGVQVNGSWLRASTSVLCHPPPLCIWARPCGGSCDCAEGGSACCSGKPSSWQCRALQDAEPGLSSERRVDVPHFSQPN